MKIQRLQVGDKSSKVLRIIVEQLTNENKTSLKIDNNKELYLPLSVQELTPIKDGSFLISLAQYGEQEGDLMCNPEICFLYRQDLEIFIPYYFRNDYKFIEEYIFPNIEDEELLKCDLKNIKVKKSLIECVIHYCEMWFRDIVKHQLLEL